MKIIDVAISVIANPHSEMVSAGVKGGGSAHSVCWVFSAYPIAFGCD
jgi:hypothetical protein